MNANKLLVALLFSSNAYALDVSFGTGLLKEIYDTVQEDPEIGIIHGHAGDFNVGSWDLFCLKDHTVARFGLFDENMYPAYSEDDDYIMRMMHAGVKKKLGLNATYYHGTDDTGGIS